MSFVLVAFPPVLLPLPRSLVLDLYLVVLLLFYFYFSLKRNLPVGQISRADTSSFNGYLAYITLIFPSSRGVP